MATWGNNFPERTPCAQPGIIPVPTPSCGRIKTGTVANPAWQMSFGDAKIRILPGHEPFTTLAVHCICEGVPGWSKQSVSEHASYVSVRCGRDVATWLPSGRAPRLFNSSRASRLQYHLQQVTPPLESLRCHLPQQGPAS